MSYFSQGQARPYHVQSEAFVISGSSSQSFETFLNFSRTKLLDPFVFWVIFHEKSLECLKVYPHSYWEIFSGTSWFWTYNCSRSVKGRYVEKNEYKCSLMSEVCSDKYQVRGDSQIGIYSLNHLSVVLVYLSPKNLNMQYYPDSSNKENLRRFQFYSGLLAFHTNNVSHTEKFILFTSSEMSDNFQLEKSWLWWPWAELDNYFHDLRVREQSSSSREVTLLLPSSDTLKLKHNN